MKKRIISVLLCAIMLVGMTPVMSLAYELPKSESAEYEAALNVNANWLWVWKKWEGKDSSRDLKNGTYITSNDGKAKKFDVNEINDLIASNEKIIAVKGTVVYIKGNWFGITGNEQAFEYGTYRIPSSINSENFYVNVYGDTHVEYIDLYFYKETSNINATVILHDSAKLLIKDYLRMDNRGCEVAQNIWTTEYYYTAKYGLGMYIRGEGSITVRGRGLRFMDPQSCLYILDDVSLTINAWYKFNESLKRVLFPDKVNVDTTGKIVLSNTTGENAYLLDDMNHLMNSIKNVAGIYIYTKNKETVCASSNVAEMDKQIQSLNANGWYCGETCTESDYGTFYNIMMQPDEYPSFYLNDKPVSSSSVDIVKGEKTNIKVVGELSKATQDLLNNGRIFWPKKGDKDAFLCKIRRGGTHELISEGTLSVSEDNSKFIITASFTPPEGDLKTDNYYISYVVKLYNSNSDLSRSWSSTLFMKAKPGDPKITGSVGYTGENKGGGTITANYKGSVPSDKLTYTWMVQKTRVRNLAGKSTFNRYWAEVAKSNDGSFTIPEDYEADLMRECKRIRVKVTAEGYREAVYGDTLIVGRNEISSELEDITITNENTSVEAGDELALQILKSPADNKDKISWKSSDTSIATVDSNGKVTGIKAGEVTITAECGTIESDVKVTVVGENHVHNYTGFSQFNTEQHMSKCGSCGTESLEDHVFTSKSGTRVCSKCGYEDVSLVESSDNSYIPKYPSEEDDEIIDQIIDKTEDTGFDDVYASDYYTDAVKWAVENDITKGKSERKFAPNDVCSRAQVVTFLWRAAGSPEPGASSVSFSDVKAGSFYEKAVLWAVEKGITNGSGEGTFSPDADCSRSQILTFLWRAQNSPAVSGINTFSDVADSAYYADAVLWAVGNDITKGTSANKFSPNAKCTRGQVVTFMYRAMSGN